MRRRCCPTFASPALAVLDSVPRWRAARWRCLPWVQGRSWPLPPCCQRRLSTGRWCFTAGLHPRFRTDSDLNLPAKGGGLDSIVPGVRHETRSIGSLEKRLVQAESRSTQAKAAAEKAATQTARAGDGKASSFNPDIGLNLQGALTKTTRDPATWTVSGSKRLVFAYLAGAAAYAAGLGLSLYADLPAGALVVCCLGLLAFGGIARIKA